MSILSTPLKPPRKTISEKKALVQQWEQSTGNMKAFCVTQGISISALKYWLRQYGHVKKRKRRGKNFVALEVAAAPVEVMGGSSPFAELIFDNGTRLVLHQQVPAGFLHTLLY